ncbi:Hypothetical protein, putative [Bodo saltans]|uniref:Uncharacterized protein n=1 Tax=Bodo saltans TaxID=75058 RepID=A0A0S4JKM1_BODSA|nr:Hypothetical protein, putative [Bodo saltans]|eukprot:CUG92056.1 Hypothetical protein, putative [Bodo saltans]
MSDAPSSFSPRGGRGGRGAGRGGNHNRHGKRGLAHFQPSEGGAAAGADVGRGGGRGGRGGFRRRRHPFVEKGERAPLPEDDAAIVQNITEDHAPTDQRRVNAAKDAKKKSAKTTSVFHDLLVSLPDATAIAAYVRENRSTTLRLSKELNRFLQAISGRADDVYDALFSNHKAEVVAILERLVDQSSGKAAQVLPPAHEWAIRCEEHGVKKATWLQDSEESGKAEKVLIKLLDGDASQLLLQPKEMLSKITAIDAQGYLLRRIELSATPKALSKAAKLVRLAVDDESFTGSQQQRTTQLSIALGRMISKTRRVLERILHSYQGTSATPATTAAADDEESAAAAEVEEKVSSTAATPATAEDIEEAKTACTTVLEIAKHTIDVLRTRTAGIDSTTSTPVTPLPVSKLRHLAEWAKTNGLLEEHLDNLVGDLSEQTNDHILQQAEQLETVMNIKAATTESTLTELLDSLIVVAASKKSNKKVNVSDDESDDEDEQPTGTSSSPPLRIRSADVLSSLAVSASGAEISAALKARVAEVLVATLRVMGEGAQLPRRAHTFVAAENNKKRQERRAAEIREKRSREEDGEEQAK